MHTMLTGIVLAFRIVLCMSFAGCIWITALAGTDTLSRSLHFPHRHSFTVEKSPTAGLPPLLLCRARGMALLFLLIPFWEVPLFFLPASSTHDLQWLPLPSPAATNPLPASSNFSGVATPSFDGYTRPFPIWETLACIWLTGTILLLLAGLRERRRFAHIVRRTGHPAPEMEALLYEVGQQLKIRRLPTLVVCGVAESPMLTGLLHPRLLLPEYSISPEQLRLIFSHELWHLKRGDLWKKLAAFCAHCLHWFNPLVWQLEGKFAMDCELACDEKVLLGLCREQRKLYGQAILHVLSQSTNRRIQGLCFCKTNRKKSQNELKRRLDLMMNPNGHSKGKRIFLTVLIAVLCVVGTGVCLVYAPALPKLSLSESKAVPSTNSPSATTAGNTSPVSLTDREESAEALLSQLENSFSFQVMENGEQKLSFQIPSELPSDMPLYLQLSARLRMGTEDENAMGEHLFEAESADNSWIPGKIYTHTFTPDSLLSCDVYYSLADASSPESLLAERSMTFSETGLNKDATGEEYLFPLSEDTPYRVVSPYGWRLVNEKPEFNYGLDLVTTEVAPIYAAIGGEVSFTDSLRMIAADGTELHVPGLMLHNESGQCVVYAGSFRAIVTEGQTIMQGQLIGRNASGEILHLEVWPNTKQVFSKNNPVNPERVLSLNT